MTKRNLKTILELTYEQYMINVQMYKNDEILLYDIGGLCLAMCNVGRGNPFCNGKLTTLEKNDIYQLLDMTVRNKQVIFFDYKGDEVVSKHQFAWKLDDFQSRIDWLETQIKKLS